MIMEVTEAIGKTAQVCVSACVKGTFLCLPQKHGIKIASLISPARHKNNMQRRERKGKGGKKTKKTKTAHKRKNETTRKVFLRLSRMSLQILPFIVLSQCRALSAAISDCQCVDLAR